MKFINIWLILMMFMFAYADELITVNFNKTEIEDVVKFVAKQSGKNILMTEKLNGSVNFISEKPIRKSELMSMLSEILQAKGYTIVETSDNYLMVTRAANAKKKARPKSESGAGMETRVLSVRYMKASDAVQKIRYLASQFSSVTFDNNKNLIIVSDYPENIDNMSATIDQIDRPIDKVVEYVALTNNSAEALAKDLATLFKAMDSSFSFPVTILPDASSNKLTVVADRSDMVKALNIIKNYDMQTVQQSLTSEVIFLNNAEAAATLKIVNGLIKSFDKDTKAAVAVEAKEDINALVLTGTKQAVAMIKEIVQKIDIEQQQVYIKAHIYEISMSDLENLGLRWGATGASTDGVTLFSSVLNAGGSAFVLPSGVLGSIDIDSVSRGLAVGATIELLNQNGIINTVSEPNLLCVNNKKSTIYIGKTQSILTSTTVQQSTTDVGRNTFAREDIGLTMEVKPQIASDHKVLLEIKTKIEDVDKAESANADQPTTLKREVNTFSIVRDGEDIIIGGLIKDTYSISESKIPLLGDIPLLGYLFKSMTESKEKINVVVMLTPYIVNKSIDLHTVQNKIANFEKLKNELSLALKKELEIVKVK